MSVDGVPGVRVDVGEFVGGNAYDGAVSVVQGVDFVHGGAG